MYPPALSYYYYYMLLLFVENIFFSLLFIIVYDLNKIDPLRDRFHVGEEVVSIIRDIVLDWSGFTSLSSNFNLRFDALHYAAILYHHYSIEKRCKKKDY